MKEKNNHTDNNPNQVAVRMHIPHEDPMFPEETLWLEAEHWAVLYSLLDQKMIDRQLPTAEVEIIGKISAFTILQYEMPMR